MSRPARCGVALIKQREAQHLGTVEHVRWLAHHIERPRSGTPGLRLKATRPAPTGVAWSAWFGDLRLWSSCHHKTLPMDFEDGTDKPQANLSAVCIREIRAIRGPIVWGCPCPPQPIHAAVVRTSLALQSASIKPTSLAKRIHRTIKITDRRRKRAMAANPPSAQPDLTKMLRGAAVRCICWFGQSSHVLLWSLGRRHPLSLCKTIEYHLSALTSRRIPRFARRLL